MTEEIPMSENDGRQQADLEHLWELLNTSKRDFTQEGKRLEQSFDNLFRKLYRQIAKQAEGGTNGTNR
ncbi:MAG: hypothetical protein ACYC9L_16145 [Sulfuricaulis sp.]